VAFAASDRPRLSRRAELRWDRLEGKHFLLYPERGLALSATAYEIVSLCDGTRTVERIVENLAAAHPEAVRSEIEAGVLSFLEELVRRGLLEWGA
jgi:coenzyme PQQ biosynthesis protein PqqD